MFGELVAVWLVPAWQALGKPSPVTIAEIGPGRGTLMKDIVRTLGRLASGADGQRRLRAGRDKPAADRRTAGDIARQRAGLQWHTTVDTLPDRAAAHRRQRAVRRPSLPPVRQAGRKMAGARGRSRRRRARFQFGRRTARSIGRSSGRGEECAGRHHRRDRTCARRADGHDRRHASPFTAAPASSSTTAISGPASATRSRRCAGTGARACSTIPARPT